MTTSESGPGREAAGTGRFARLERVARIGVEGRRRIGEARVAIIGCGALGTHIAESLARVGIGRLILVDRDIVERTNLDRQTLFEEEDARLGRAKAPTVAERLSRIHGGVDLRAEVIDLDHTNVHRVLEDVDLVMDGTDNFSTRYLVNERCVEAEVPWVHAGVIGVSGVVLPVIPGRGPCFPCYLPEEPPPGEVETCETAGVLVTAVAVVSALAVTAGLRILIEGAEAIEPRLTTLNVWKARFGSIQVARRADCSVCVERRFEHMAGVRAVPPAVLCGRMAVQVRPDTEARPDLEAIADRLEGSGLLHRHEMMVRFEVDGGIEVTLFADGRAIVHGTDDPGRARSIYARHVGC